MTDELDPLVTRLRRLTAEQLTTVEDLVSRLERGGLSPAPGSTTAAQRFAAQVAAANTATRAQVRTIYGFKIDRVRVRDDFQPT